MLQMYCPEICGHCCRESFCMMQQLVINQLINNSEDDQRALGSQEPSSLYSRAEGNTPRKAFVPLHRLCSLMWSKPRLERLPGVGAIQTHESRTEKEPGYGSTKDGATALSRSWTSTRVCPSTGCYNRLASFIQEGHPIRSPTSPKDEKGVLHSG